MTETLTCTRCMGTGISNHPDSGETCDDCNGRGAIPEEMSDDEDKAKICQVTGTYCSHDDADICIDYGCVRKPAPPRNYGRIIYGPEGSGWWEYEQ